MAPVFLTTGPLRRVGGKGRPETGSPRPDRAGNAYGRSERAEVGEALNECLEMRDFPFVPVLSSGGWHRPNLA